MSYSRLGDGSDWYIWADTGGDLVICPSINVKGSQGTLRLNKEQSIQLHKALQDAIKDKWWD